MDEWLRSGDVPGPHDRFTRDGPGGEPSVSLFAPLRRSSGWQVKTSTGWPPMSRTCGTSISPKPHQAAWAHRVYRPNGI